MITQHFKIFSPKIPGVIHLLTIVCFSNASIPLLAYSRTSELSSRVNSDPNSMSTVLLLSPSVRKIDNFQNWRLHNMKAFLLSPTRRNVCNPRYFYFSSSTIPLRLTSRQLHTATSQTIHESPISGSALSKAPRNLNAKMKKSQFRAWHELEDHEKDQQDFVQRLINETRARREKKEKRDKAATRLRLYGPLKRAGRKRAWKKKGVERERDEKGRFL